MSGWESQIPLGLSPATPQPEPERHAFVGGNNQGGRRKRRTRRATLHPSPRIPGLTMHRTHPGRTKPGEPEGGRSQPPMSVPTRLAHKPSPPPNYQSQHTLWTPVLGKEAVGGARLPLSEPERTAVADQPTAPPRGIGQGKCGWPQGTRRPGGPLPLGIRLCVIGLKTPPQDQ